MRPEAVPDCEHTWFQVGNEELCLCGAVRSVLPASPPDPSSARIRVRTILRKHVSGVASERRGGRVFHDAACAECQSPLPWGAENRGHAIIDHQVAVILKTLGVES